MDEARLKELLDKKYSLYDNHYFIENDPICIPHRFERLQDQEIAAFFAAILAWGRRKTIIDKTTELLAFMDNAPHDFMLYHQEKDLKRFLSFKHRTFTPTDTLYCIYVLSSFHKKINS